MQPVARVSLVEAAIERLDHAVTSGQWPVGTRIPTEAELGEQLGLGRTTIREAVRALVHAGLLETRQGQGTFVVAKDASAVALSRRLADGSQSDVLEVRRALDVVAARLAAQRRTSDDLAALDEALARRSRAALADDPVSFAQADIDLHLGIARASGNVVLVDLYGGLVAALRRSVSGDGCLDAFRRGDTAHDDLVASVHDGDTEAALAATARILDPQDPGSGGRPT